MNRPYENTGSSPEPENAPRAAAGASSHEREQGAEHLGGVRYTPPHPAGPDTARQHSDPDPEPSAASAFAPIAGPQGGVVSGPTETPEESVPDHTPEAVPRALVTLSGVESGGDVMAAGGNVTKVVNAPVHFRYQQGPALLRSHEIGPDEILSEDLFVSTGPAEDVRSGVYALIGPPNTGRRTEGRQLLSSLPDMDRLREFRTPDWDEPDMGRVPNDPRHGYLLDLTGMGEALPDDFGEDLARYARNAREHGSLLVILGDEAVGDRLPSADEGSGIVVREHQRPDALVVARRRIHETALRERTAWLDIEGGTFHGLVSSDAPPSRGVDLAQAVLEAKNENDDTVLGAFANWQKQIQDWFATDVRREDATGAEQRALRIAAAFLDGSPAPAVLNAADELLSKPVRDRFELWGGALAAPDDQVRCRTAGVDFRDGRVSITDNRPGLDSAVIRYLWDRRGSLSALLTTWLSDISSPGGPASECLDRLSTVLMEVAVAQGSATVLGLLEEWLKQDARRRMDFVVKVLQRLTEHPVLGPRVRVVDLRNWARGSGSPERQRAVIRVCRGGFAEEYPEQALMRLRYVVQNTEDTDLRGEAIAALAEHLAPGRDRLSVLKVLVDWVENERIVLDGGRLFLDLFGGDGADGETAPADPARGLLTPAGSEGETAVELFRRAWKSTWNHPELRNATSHALVVWRRAAHAGSLPVDRTRRVIRVVFGSSGIDEDLDRILSGEDQVGAMLRKDFLHRP